MSSSVGQENSRESSLSCSQDPANGLYPDPHSSSSDSAHSKT